MSRRKKRLELMGMCVEHSVWINHLHFKTYRMKAIAYAWSPEAYASPNRAPRSSSFSDLHNVLNGYDVMRLEYLSRARNMIETKTLQWRAVQGVSHPWEGNVQVKKGDGDRKGWKGRERRVEENWRGRKERRDRIKGRDGKVRDRKSVV